jgi:hypothetical protein
LKLEYNLNAICPLWQIDTADGGVWIEDILCSHLSDLLLVVALEDADDVQKPAGPGASGPAGWRWPLPLKLARRRSDARRAGVQLLNLLSKFKS